jgi:hypothetical protein
MFQKKQLVGGLAVVGLSLFAASLFSVSTVSLAEAKNAVGAACKDCTISKTTSTTCSTVANCQGGTLTRTVSTADNDGNTYLPNQSVAICSTIDTKKPVCAIAGLPGQVCQ